MAFIIRPAVLRQAAAAPAVFSRALSTKVALVPTAFTRPTTSALARPAFRNAFARETVRVAAFHATSKQAILPPGPQVIDGTANDAAKVPNPSPTHGSYHWTFERLVSVGLIPLTIAPFASGSLSPISDALLCGLILIHAHIGFEACIQDYFPPRQVPKFRKFCDYLLKIATVLVGVGLYEFETNDVGLTEAIKRIWIA